ncbi:phosphopantetheine adenylyltransferase [Methanolapillus ohkumae]
MVKVVLGGTFEYLHAGHSRLIERAFLILKESGGGFVHIGLTSDEMTQKKSHAVSDYETRKKEIEKQANHLIQKYGLLGDCFLITKLNDPIGPAASEDFDFIVISPETRSGAEKINQIRKENGRSEIQICEVDFVMAQDNIPISSTRIYKGEIDKYGRIQRQLNQHNNPSKNQNKKTEK